MKQFAPDYYPQFACIAGQCRHSCCVGWEIDIDAETLERYRHVTGEWGVKLNSNICSNEGTSCFRLTENERCPFLNQEGLCELILTFGEESLCQICMDHPRFFNEYSDRTEAGLGLCCEAAAPLILGRKDPVRLICLEDDGQADFPDEEDENFLIWRDKWIARAQDRSKTIFERLDEISSFEFSLDEWRSFLLSLERMDEAWADCLNQTASQKEWDPAWEIPFEQLLVYLLYRHLSASMADGDESGWLGFIALACEMIMQLFLRGEQTMRALCEIARLYSSEIEYSDENIGAIIAEWHRRNG